MSLRTMLTDDTTTPTDSQSTAQHPTADTTTAEMSSAQSQVHEGPHGMTVVEIGGDDSDDPEPSQPAVSGPSSRRLLIAAALGGATGAVLGMALTVVLLVILELPGVGAA